MNSFCPRALMLALWAGVAALPAQAQAVDRAKLAQAAGSLSGIPPDTTIAPELAPEPGVAADIGDPSAATDGRGTLALQQLQQAMVQELQSLQLSGDTDRDFALLMQRRLQQDMQLALLEVRHGRSRELRTMALRLYQAQRGALERLTQWLEQQDRR